MQFKFSMIACLKTFHDERAVRQAYDILNSLYEDNDSVSFDIDVILDDGAIISYEQYLKDKGILQ